MLLVADCKSEDLKLAIAQWKKTEASLESQRAAASSSPGKSACSGPPGAAAKTPSETDASALGHRPPCKSFANLTTRQEVHDKIESYYECHGKHSMEEVTDGLKPYKSAMMELCQNVRQQHVDAAKALTAA